MRTILMTILMTSLLPALSACASTPTSRCADPHAAGQTVHDRLGARLDGLLAAAHAQGTFDGAVLVAHRGTIVLRKGYGCADRRSRIAASAGTISDIGSIAKTFTAAAILRLESQGLLSRDDTLAKFYPDAPADKRGIGIGHLLTHRAGLDDFHADTDFEPMQRAEAEARILALPLKFAPGDDEAYSNAGYTLLAAIVERVSGRGFLAYVREELLRPAALSDTGWYGDGDIDVSRLARGYGGQEAGRTTFERNSTWALIGAGGMVSTVDDLYAWHSALSRGALSLGAVPAAQVFSPVAGGRWSEGSWRTLEIGGQTVVDMGGSTDFGYTAKLMRVPATDTVVVLLLNAHSDTYGAGTHHVLGNRILLPAIVEAALDDALPD